ncbi:MAG: formylglycine-generating enzyme family protein, partial [Candidatus Competibacteraceae bacterium]|nr:formylglycine-generating enzyme family protein [Candidatus Competibacteraceae bacterium]
QSVVFAQLAEWVEAKLITTNGNEAEAVFTETPEPQTAVENDSTSTTQPSQTSVFSQPSWWLRWVIALLVMVAALSGGIFLSKKMDVLPDSIMTALTAFFSGSVFNISTIPEPEMVEIPAGRFWMGSDPNQDKDAYKSEQPRHEVAITQPFWMGKYEVTFEEYDTFARATGRDLPNDSGWGRGKRPVINVSWEDATAYAKWLSEQTGKPYRLPTEAEWEYAVRAGTETPYWWGEETACDYANVADLAAKKQNPEWEVFECDDGFVNTAPVGQFKQNNFDLYDISGNVWEWVQDCWHENYEGAPADGSAWEGEKDCPRVLRGGSWNYKPRRVRSASRYRYYRYFRHFNVGFRLARSK